MTSKNWYQALSREELERRCGAAERVALLVGWTASRSGFEASVRDKALHEFWRAWLELAGDEFTSPRAHPDLDDEHLQPLADRRDATREATLRGLRGEDA